MNPQPKRRPARSGSSARFGRSRRPSSRPQRNVLARPSPSPAQPASPPSGRAAKFSLATRAVVGAYQNNRHRLRVIPLGGQEEVGRNMTVFEYGDDIIILDMGLQFPEEDMPGIDYIIPDISYLRGKEKNIRGVIFSHGHLDHIGAAPILLEKLGYPLIVGRPLTLAMLKHRQEDYKGNSSKRLKTATIKGVQDVFRLGQFTIRFFQVEHSVMDAVGVIIETPVATIIHPGDWTLEKDDAGRPTIDYSFLTRLRRPTVLMLESLGSTDVRKSATLQQMQENMTRLVSDVPGRLIIGTFASQIERIGWIIETAERLGKKVALDGYSMKMNMEFAQQLGYVKPRKGTLIKPDQIHRFPDNKLVIIVTGAQGESNAVFSRVITGAHRFIKVKKSDTIVFSSSVIPGNERTIQRLKDSLYRECDNVIHGEVMDIHVSGHANRDDIAWMIRSIKPDYFLPVYANHYMLKEATKLAKTLGYTDDTTFVLDNGQVGEFTAQGGRPTTERVSSEYVFVDGLGVGDISHVVLRDRQAMATDGMFVVIMTVRKKTGELIQNPDIISRGFIHMKESKKLLEETRRKVRTVLAAGNHTTEAFDVYIKNRVRNELGEFLWQKTQRRPMILPVLIEV